MKKFSLISLLVITGLAIIVRFQDLKDMMPFFGDQAWFYMSARDALISGQLPLISITTSVTTFNQGAMWTYLLIPGLVISGFNPVSGAILAVVFNLLAMPLIYYLTGFWFGRRAALISLFVFATSPLSVAHARLSYHTTPIPFLLAMMMLAIKLKKYTLLAMSLGFLYHMELATIIFWPAVIYFLVRQKYKPDFKDGVVFGLTLLPFLLAGPIKTFGPMLYPLWHLFRNNGGAVDVGFYGEFLSKLIVPGIPVISFGLLLFGVLGIAFHKGRGFLWWIVFCGLGIAVKNTGSEAYFSMLIIPMIVIAAYGLSLLKSNKVLYPVLGLIWVLNIHYIYKTDFLMSVSDYGKPISEKVLIANKILDNSLSTAPKIRMTGIGSEFESSQMVYRYLLWWKSKNRTAQGIGTEFVIDDNVPEVIMIK